MSPPGEQGIRAPVNRNASSSTNGLCPTANTTSSGEEGSSARNASSFWSQRESCSSIQSASRTPRASRAFASSLAVCIERAEGLAQMAVPARPGSNCASIWGSFAFKERFPALDNSRSKSACPSVACRAFPWRTSTSILRMGSSPYEIWEERSKLIEPIQANHDRLAADPQR